MRRITLPLALAVTALSLTGCSAFTPEPAPTVTVTATPETAGDYAVSEATTPAEEPLEESDTQTDQATSDAAETQAPTQAPGLMNPSAAVNGYLQAELPHLFNPNTPITNVGVEDDDVIIDFKLPMGVNATTNYAGPTVEEVISVLRQHTDDPNIAYLDLVAVRTTDGGIAAMDQITPHPQAAGA